MELQQSSLGQFHKSLLVSSHWNESTAWNGDRNNSLRRNNAHIVAALICINEEQHSRRR